MTDNLKTNTMTKQLAVMNEKAASEVIARRVTHNPVGLEFDPATTFEEWQLACQFYGLLAEKSQWYLGDAIRFGETAYGEKYAQAIEATGQSYSTLTTIVSVCNRIPIERRRESLPFSHHEAVAYLDPAKADEVLDKAQQEKWTRKDVREAVAKIKGKPVAASGKSTQPVAEVKIVDDNQSAHALLDHFVSAIKKLDVEKMTMPQKSAWLMALLPVDEFIDALQK